MTVGIDRRVIPFRHCMGLYEVVVCPGRTMIDLAARAVTGGDALPEIPDPDGCPMTGPPGTRTPFSLPAAGAAIPTPSRSLSGATRSGCSISPTG